MFLRFREAITIIFPYLGLPTCIPACYGMIGVVQRKGARYASTKSLRKKTITEDDVQKGIELRARIYRGVGNSDIFSLMDRYFTDLCECHLLLSATWIDHRRSKSADLWPNSHDFDGGYMGISYRESERGGLPATGVAPCRGHGYHGLGSHSSD